MNDIRREKLLDYSRYSISKWLKLRDEGKLQPVPAPRGPHKLFLEPLKAYIDEHPDSALEEAANYFLTAELIKALRKLGDTYKKTKNLQAERRIKEGY